MPAWTLRWSRRRPVRDNWISQLGLLSPTGACSKERSSDLKSYILFYFYLLFWATRNYDFLGVSGKGDINQILNINWICHCMFQSLSFYLCLLHDTHTHTRDKAFLCGLGNLLKLSLWWSFCVSENVTGKVFCWKTLRSVSWGGISVWQKKNKLLLWNEKLCCDIVLEQRKLYKHADKVRWVETCVIWCVKTNNKGEESEGHACIFMISITHSKSTWAHLLHLTALPNPFK